MNESEHISFHWSFFSCLFDFFYYLRKIENQRCNFHSINIIWSFGSFVAESEVHDFRMMVAIHQPSNMFSHSLKNCSNFLELSVEILTLWNCHFKGLVLYLAWMICHLEHHCNIRILMWSVAVWAHSHTQLPLKIYKLAGDFGLSIHP